MKAVKRIRSFGYHELTFDAFAIPPSRKPSACKATIRRRNVSRKSGDTLPIRSTKKPEGGTLGAELMDRFRRYLKGEGTL